VGRDDAAHLEYRPGVADGIPQHPTEVCRQTPLEDRLTVVLATSPVPSHPSTALIDHVLESFSLAGLDKCRLVIVCDGCIVQDRARPKRGIVTAAVAAAYCEFVQQLQDRYATDKAVRVLALEKHHGFAFAVKAALSLVQTRFLCVVQHDNAFVRQVDLQCALQALEDPRVKYVGLLSSATLDYVGLCNSRYGIRISALEINGVPLVPLVYWYDKTHIASVDYYRSLFELAYDARTYWLLPDTHPPEDAVKLGRRGGLVIKAGDFIEETLGKKELFDIRTFGLSAHEQYGTYLYLDHPEPAFRHFDGQKYLTPQRRAELGFAPKVYGPDDGRVEDYRLTSTGPRTI